MSAIQKSSERSECLAGTCQSTCSPVQTCFDSSSNLTWATTGAQVLSWYDATALCASFGGSWRLPTLTELTKWPWVGAGTLANSSCSVSTSYDSSRASTDPVNFVWSSTSYTGTVGGSGPTCPVYYQQASIDTGHLVGVACPNLVWGQAICVE